MSCQDHVFMEFQLFFIHLLFSLAFFLNFITVYFGFHWLWVKYSQWVLNQDQTQYSIWIRLEMTSIQSSLLQKCSVENDSHSEILLSFQLSSQTIVFVSLTWHILVQKSELKYYQNLFADLRYLFPSPCTVTIFRVIWEKS